MDFRDVLRNDLEMTFHNDSEFSGKMKIMYDGAVFEASVLLDQSAMDERYGNDMAQGIFRSSIHCFVMKDHFFGNEPRRNHYITLGDTEYIILSVSEELDEYALELEIADE